MHYIAAVSTKLLTIGILCGKIGAVIGYYGSHLCFSQLKF